MISPAQAQYMPGGRLWTVTSTLHTVKHSSYYVKNQLAVGISKFANNDPSTPYAPLSHPFKPSSWFEILSLPTLISVAILPVLWRSLFFFLALSLPFPTPPVHSSTPIFIKATIALSASQNTQGCKPAFHGNSESQNRLGSKSLLKSSSPTSLLKQGQLE